MLFCRLCAVVTSFATTYAWTGCCDCPPIASANWFVSLAPTILKLGGCEPPPPLGALPEAAPPPPLLFGILTLAIFLTFANPTTPVAIAWAIAYPGTGTPEKAFNCPEIEAYVLTKEDAIAIALPASVWLFIQFFAPPFFFATLDFFISSYAPFLLLVHFTQCYFTPLYPYEQWNKCMKRRVACAGGKW